MIALKLTTDADLKISPEDFLKNLTASAANLDSLTRDLQCSPEDLAETLTDPKTIDLIKLKTHLVTLQIKLLAIQYLPHAFTTLVKLTQESDKPEVTRRAATTLLHLAGIPTDTKPQPPTLTLDKQEEQINQSEQQAEDVTPLEDEQALDFMRKISTMQDLGKEGIDLTKLPDIHFPALVRTLTDFLATHPLDKKQTQ